MRTFMTIMVLVIALPLLAGCAESAEEADPSDAIEAYWQAAVKGEVDKMVSLSCPDWERQARLQGQSIPSQNPRLEGLSCKAGEKSGDYTLVHCEGTMYATYEGEERDQALGTYRALAVDDEWKMCGEAE